MDTSTAYTLGQTVVPATGFTSAGGKFLRCTTAGTTGAVATLAVPAVGSTLVDGSVTWTAVSGVPCPSALFISLLVCSNGIRANSTAYVLNNTIVVLVGTKYYFYKATTAGTSAAAQPGAFVGVANEVVTDGTAVFTEQTAALDAGTAQVEVTGGNYARAPLAASLANWAGTQAAASVVSSTGTLGLTSNNTTITYGIPSANWNTAPALIWGFGVYDQLTAGNALEWVALNLPQSVLNGQAAPSFAAAALTLQIGN